MVGTLKTPSGHADRVVGQSPIDSGAIHLRMLGPLQRIIVIGLIVGLILQGTGRAAEEDALHARVLSELHTFTDWLETHRVKGYIGEVGWPDDVSGDAREWNDLADRWFEAADDAGLWVTTWATGEWWGTAYNLAAYEDRREIPGVETANTQAEVLEAHLGTDTYRRGITVAGGEFAAPSAEPESGFSNRNPGVYDRQYHYDGRGTFEYLASRGIGLVRIPFRWERLQPRLGGHLAKTEVRRLSGAVRRAGAAGLKVVLDMHNYGAYYRHRDGRGVRCAIGSRGCRIRRFVDVWRRISRRFGDRRPVIGYGLMNEPVGLSPTGDLAPEDLWERASKRAVRAIRRRGDRKWILVSGYFWSGVQNWDKFHPRPWIPDSFPKVRYEAHHYWDSDNSGDYPDRYQREVELARARGY